MRPIIFQILAIAFLITGCATIQPRNIVFNKEKGIYEYPVNRQNSIALRNKFQQLVDTSNYGNFTVELTDIKNRYPFKSRLEKDQLLKNSDFELSERYGKSNAFIIEKDFQKAVDELNKLSAIDPEISNYSDASFLKGYAFEKLGKTDSAQIMYEHFLKYASQKFSSRFRGYRDEDQKDRFYISERNYAKNYLGHQDQAETVRFYPIKPKYYFGSLQPGYSLNTEDLTRNSKSILMFMFGSDINGDLTSGLQYYYKINERFSINPRYAVSRNMKEFSLAAPIQLYKSENNQFGLKLTPFMNYLRVDSATIEGHQYEIKENFINFGARISAGFYPIQHLAIGAYYQANNYNKQNPFQSKKTQIELWLTDEYDVSLYYNIYKGLSLKSGVKNEDLVAGIMYSCWEISYNITHPGLIFRVDMY